MEPPAAPRYLGVMTPMRFSLVLTLLLWGGAAFDAPAQERAAPGKAAEPAETTRSDADRASERARMVEEQIAERDIEDRRVLDALRTVPRHEFVPERYRRMAYADQPLPIGEGQTISQPYIVALMTELLQLDRGDKVLEVGTGSGYQAAVASVVADSVFTIEIIETLASSAAERLERLGYANVVARQGDGYFGWEERGPFDGILVTAAAGHIPPPLVKQLKPGGRMVIPVGGAFQLQHLVLVTKEEDGKVTTRNLLPVAFVPLLGH